MNFASTLGLVDATSDGYAPQNVSGLLYEVAYCIISITVISGCVENPLQKCDTR